MHGKKIWSSGNDVAGVWQARIAAGARHRCRACALNTRAPGSPPDSRACLNSRKNYGRWRSDGNDLDIPQCWPVPFRTCARLLKPRGPSRWPPRVARSWTGLCEWPPRPPRGSNRSTVRCPLLFPDANSGLVGCLGCSDVEFDRACSLETAPANPRQAQTTKVCATARGAPSAVRPPLNAAGGFHRGSRSSRKVRWPGAMRGSAPRPLLCLLLWRSPLRRDEIASCMPHLCHPLRAEATEGR
jgi:hypothetical protein